METTRATSPAASPAALIDRVVREVEPLERRHHEAVWKMNLTGSAADAEESGRLDAELRMIYARRDDYAHLRGQVAAGGTGDPRLDRQIRLLELACRPFQIAPDTIAAMVKLEKDLEGRFNRFRAELEGESVTDNRIREILRESTDGAERRRAWEASKQVGSEAVGPLLELVRLRNRAAQELGNENYYSMMLAVEELDEGELFRLLDDLEQGTRPLFASYRRELGEQLAARFGVASDDLMPWHFSDPFFQEAPATEVDLDPVFEKLDVVELSARFFESVGLDARGLLARADLYEKPGKCQHAFCMSVDRGADIRVLCNVRPSEHWMGTMLHELGHAVYDLHIDPALPFLLRAPAHTLTTEASAMLFGRLSKNAAWLARYAGLDARTAQETGATIARSTVSQLLVQTRWCLVMCHMERALYRDPGQDLNGLWWSLVERFQGVRRPAGRSAPDWASKIHFSVAPVYYHNYMMGEIMASQLQRVLKENVIGDVPGRDDRYVSSPAVGEYLRTRLYRPGKSVDWRGAIRGATGEDLSPQAFVAELAAR